MASQLDPSEVRMVQAITQVWHAGPSPLDETGVFGEQRELLYRALEVGENIDQSSRWLSDVNDVIDDESWPPSAVKMAVDSYNRQFTMLEKLGLVPADLRSPLLRVATLAPRFLAEEASLSDAHPTQNVAVTRTISEGMYL